MLRNFPGAEHTNLWFTMDNNLLIAHASYFSTRFHVIAAFADAFYANLGSRRSSLEETKNSKEKGEVLSNKNVRFSLEHF